MVSAVFVASSSVSDGPLAATGLPSTIFAWRNPSHSKFPGRRRNAISDNTLRVFFGMKRPSTSCTSISSATTALSSLSYLAR